MTKDPCSKEELYFTTDQELPWTLGKKQLHIAGLSRMHTYAWSTMKEQGFSSQPVRYPGHCIIMSRLLGVCMGFAKGKVRGQGDVGLQLNSPLPPHQSLLDSVGFTYTSV